MLHVKDIGLNDPGFNFCLPCLGIGRMIDLYQALGKLMLIQMVLYRFKSTSFLSMGELHENHWDIVWSRPCVFGNT